MEINDLKSPKEIKGMDFDDLLDYATNLTLFAKEVLLDGNAYLHYALNKQLKDLSQQMAKVKVDITNEEDNKLFDNILKLAIQSDKISEGLENVKARVKSDQFDHIKDAAEGTIEWAIKEYNKNGKPKR